MDLNEPITDETSTKELGEIRSATIAARDSLVVQVDNLNQQIRGLNDHVIWLNGALHGRGIDPQTGIAYPNREARRTPTPRKAPAKKRTPRKRK